MFWTLDRYGDVWEWCPDCHQQLELDLGDAIEYIDRVGSVSAPQDAGRLEQISEVIARLDELPF